MATKTKGAHVVTRVAAATALVLMAVPSFAQSTSGSRTVQDIVAFLVTNQGVQTSDFDKDREAAEATRATLTRALLASIATQPVSSSSGGFTYRFNPELGTVERASDTFGPFYVERALTAGAGQASLGFTFQYASFQSVDGNDLRNGGFVTVANQFTDEQRPFDVETLTLNIATRTATFFGNVGLTNRIDIGVAVPLVQLDINGTRLNTYRGTTALLAGASAKTTGFGDIALRPKVRFTPDGPAAVSAVIEVRLPTGRDEDLLGAGDTAVRLLGLASYESGRASVHGNIGVGTGGIGRDVSYGGAAAMAATSRVTLVGELVGHRIAGLQRITPIVAPHPRIRGVTTTRLMPSGDDQMSVFAVAGMKWNVGGTWLLQANVLVPLTDSGLTTKATPTIAFDYSFGR
jgi:hypothetical protein